MMRRSLLTGTAGITGWSARCSADPRDKNKTAFRFFGVVEEKSRYHLGFSAEMTVR
jgi:hypothetical protein